MEKFLKPITVIGIMTIFFQLSSCTSTNPEQRPDPAAMINELLVLHHLKGRLPEDRTEQQKNTPVDPQTLNRFFLDTPKDDAFIRDLYIGFTLGALARNQNNLFVEKKGKRATVSAGNAKFQLVYELNQWRIDLERSIPDTIKEKAKQEKTKVDNAKKNKPPLN